MSISFPNYPVTYTPNTTVAFAAEWNGIHITCEISTEALMDNFGAASSSGNDWWKHSTAIAASSKRLRAL